MNNGNNKSGIMKMNNREVRLLEKGKGC